MTIVPHRVGLFEQWRRSFIQPLLCGGALLSSNWSTAYSQSLDASRLPPEVVESIEHKSRGIRPQEREAYYQSLRYTQCFDYEQQKSLARRHIDQRRAESVYADRPREDFPVFVDVFTNFEDYHGKLVTLEGHVRRMNKFAAGPNEQGIDTLYEAWMFAADSQSNPAVVICVSVPEGMPVGDNLVEHVSVTGYFFKMYAYEARDAVRLAPMIHAQRLEWHPRERFGIDGISPLLLYLLVAAAFLVVAWVAWSNRRAVRRLRESRLARETDTTPPDFSSWGSGD